MPKKLLEDFINKKIKDYDKKIFQEQNIHPI